MVLFLFLLVITRVYAPFDQSLALIAEMFVSQVSANRINEIYETPIAKGAEAFRPQGHDIVFDHVGFAYDKKQVLRDVSFTAKEGEVTALVGPSGSGKSTCARLAARLWDATEGTIRVGGVDIASVDPEVLLTDYSMVFQDVVLFDDTVMENIRLGKRGATDEEVRTAARAANCDEFVSHLPQGYDTSIGENGTKLSGGERQRISIARALLKDAPIVLLDEATASLDVENETKVQEALSQLLMGKTVLVNAHRMRTVSGADQIVVLENSRIAQQGSPDELEQQGVHGQIAFARHLEEDAAVGVLVLVPGIGADIEEGVVAQAVRLMYLKIETDGGHAISSPQQAGRRWRAAWWRHSPSGCSSVLHGNCGLPRRPAGDRPAGRRSCWPFPAHPRSRP